MSTEPLFVEAGCLTEKKMSGIGHTTLSVINHLAVQQEFKKRYHIVLLVPFNKVDVVKSHPIHNSVKIKKLFVPGKIMNGMVRFNILPYMDIFFGKGVYLFPNFKNWPLLFSKSITYIHDVYFRVKPEHIEKKNLDLLNHHVETFIARSNRVVTVSKHAKNEIEHYFSNAEDKVAVVYNGIDHDIYYPRPLAEQQEVAAKYGIEPKRYFVFLSNIEPRKNVGALLEAFKLFVDTTHENDIALLLIGGMGWGNESILERIGQLQEDGYNVIKPSHYVSDTELPAILSGSIALVHPALYEGFGLSPLQAMATGTQVIVGNNSSLPEVMGQDYAEYVDVTNSASIQEAMETFFSKPVLNTYGIRRATDFSWNKNADQLYTIINEVNTKEK